MKIIKVIMDAGCNMHYAAFYIDGIRKKYEKKTVFSFNEFQQFVDKNRCFLFKIITEKATFNVVIDFHDPRDIDSDMLLWSDVYAKINFHKQISKDFLLKSLDGNLELLNENFPKIISIAPSFGIRVFNLSETLQHLFFILRNQKTKVAQEFKKVILDNLRMYIKRVPISNYFYVASSKKQIFMMASIWHKTTSFVNLARANFIRACQANPNIKFEGGFVAIGYECDYIPDLEKLKTGTKKMNLLTYICKTQQSLLVFNTPSVEYCHGWKIGEYLCLGKAIISTALSNELPFPLEHGKNIHFVENNEDDIQKAIQYFIDNPAYVQQLEHGALQYWEQYCKPDKVIELIVAKLVQN
ncbi:MAG: hypothetical protein H7239_01450 [Flavobacterium sp.]|nr:hypothetical protein [Flavobacterium sp.]